MKWVKKLTSKNETSFNDLPHSFLKGVGGSNVFRSNVGLKEFRGIERVKNVFWKKALRTWLDTQNAQEDGKIYYQDTIFNNCNLKYCNKTLFIPNLIK